MLTHWNGQGWTTHAVRLHNWGSFILQMRWLWRPLTVCPLLLTPIITGDHWGHGAMVSTTRHGGQGKMAQLEMRCSSWIWGNTFPPWGQWGSGTGCLRWLHSLHPLEVFKTWQEKCPSTLFELMVELQPEPEVPENCWDPSWLEQSLILMILQVQLQFGLVFTREAIYW